MELDEAALELHPCTTAVCSGGATKRVTKPCHVSPVGLLLGLGFDTASQVGLLVLAAGTAAFVLP